ncbi:MAG: metallophosphoesterase, partial [Sandaracinaceae bacterium]|nr:metallophosphoesterase [Sandaracinaceae bacterium]
MSSNRYLVVSDLHLCDVEDHPDGWKAHKAGRFVPDEELRQLFEKFVEEAREGDALTLVLNGDVLDFDLVTAVPEAPPWPLRALERSFGLDATEAKSRWKLDRVLADHETFLGALAAFAAAGHRIVYVIGNHDREVHFPAVKQGFVEAVREAGRA